ncbi:helix-turn-helix transcriptional regulator [Nitrospirillum sp. BR 11163]|uniref:helix-turn-helix transcriptional regulator n=1 Tax=Nitrospirillum sp. BR 11163 TaxID=3104323 RepID=UPI002B00229F|nr:WYL domain-containing protein [Nitrospirillum sp. BR 11163]MEA1677708.1 WYL domain-containing protein [Nitrospirillum sp. BR 11163]
MLEEGYDLPPLMLTPDEIEAAVLGAQWVSTQADPALARAAQDLIAKIAAAVPDRLRPYVLEPATRMPPRSPVATPDGLDMAHTRAWIHAGRKIRLSYADEGGRGSDRIVWPVTVAYFHTVRLLVAWCELRRDFRHFRTDRVTSADFLDERYPDRPAVLRDRWLEDMRRRWQARGAAEN